MKAPMTGSPLPNRRQYARMVAFLPSPTPVVKKHAPLLSPRGSVYQRRPPYQVSDTVVKRYAPLLNPGRSSSGGSPLTKSQTQDLGDVRPLTES